MGAFSSDFLFSAAPFECSSTYVSDSSDETRSGMHFGRERGVVEGYVVGREEGSFWELQLLSYEHALIQREEKTLC